MKEFLCHPLCKISFIAIAVMVLSINILQTCSMNAKFTNVQYICHFARLTNFVLLLAGKCHTGLCAEWTGWREGEKFHQNCFLFDLTDTA